MGGRMSNGPVRTAAAFTSSALLEAEVEIDGVSPAITQLRAQVDLVAGDAFVTVLILGESGTGKERVARAIHQASRRRRAPFVVVNCAGLSPTLVEDELFGHVRGAFTGAVADREGPFEYAHGGTVFLDEIGELSPELQVKLLRVLQQRTIQRLGARQETTFDAQILAATNVHLAQATARGRFREDLYYRLTVYELEVPPLRKRGTADLCCLADAILQRLAARRQQRAPTLDPDLVESLGRYAWPGNVRELENTLERMVVASGGSQVLTMQHLPNTFGTALHRREPASMSGLAASRGAPASSDEIREALAHNEHSRERAAAHLGLSRHQLYRRLQRMALDSNDAE